MFCSPGWTCLLIASLTVFAVVAGAQVPGDSSAGTLEIAKDHFALKYGFAIMEADPFSNGEKENLVVLLSDVPVPNDLRKASNDWKIWASDQAAAGAVPGLVVTIDPATGIWDSGNVLTRKGLMFYTESVSGGAPRNLKFEPSGPIGDRVAGKLSMKEPMTGMSDDDGPWRIDADFHCSVVRRPAVTGVLTGQAALSSPQYKAVMAFLQACRKKDVGAIRDAVSPQSRETMTKMFAAGKDEALNMFAQMAEQAFTFKLTKVTVRGDAAEVEFASAKPDSGDSQTLRLVLAAGEWKIAQ